MLVASTQQEGRTRHVALFGTIDNDDLVVLARALEAPRPGDDALRLHTERVWRVGGAGIETIARAVLTWYSAERSLVFVRPCAVPLRAALTTLLLDDYDEDDADPVDRQMAADWPGAAHLRGGSSLSALRPERTRAAPPASATSVVPHGERDPIPHASGT